MRNAGLDEAQARIKIPGRNINNLKYADNTTLMAESEEELKSLLMKVKCVSHPVVSNSLQPHGLYPPESSVHGIFQARILEWVAVSFSRGSSQPRDQTWASCTADSLLSEPPQKPDENERRERKSWLKTQH